MYIILILYIVSSSEIDISVLSGIKSILNTLLFIFKIIMIIKNESTNEKKTSKLYTFLINYAPIIFNNLLEFVLKYKSLQEIQQNPVWIKLQSKGTDKKQLNEQFLSLTEDEKVIAIDLFESLKVVMEDLLKKNNTQN